MNKEIKTVRKRRVISLRFKLRILDRIKKGERPAHVAASLGLNESTVRSICVNEKKIRSSVGVGRPVSACYAGRCRPKILEKMEFKLNNWISTCIAETNPPDTISIKQKAISIYDSLKSNGEAPTSPDFAASTGWFERFRKRYLIINTKIKEEITSDHEIESYSEDFLRVPANNQDWNINTKQNRKRKPKKTEGNEEFDVTNNKKQKNCTSSISRKNLQETKLGQAEESDIFYQSSEDPLYLDRQQSTKTHSEEACLRQVEFLPEIQHVPQNTFETNQINVDIEPFTLKGVKKGLNLAKELELYFLQEDPFPERSAKFRADLNNCLAPYTKIYNHLTQLKITDFFPKYNK